MKKDDYILGGHHFWIHFWCGLVVGAGLGARISWAIFDGRLAIIASTAVIALIFAWGCGRWGDEAWYFIGKFLGKLFYWWWW